MQPLPSYPHTRFSHPPLSLATTHGITQCFLFLRVLRCFTSPRSPQHPIHSGAGNPTSLGLGYPIRTPSDHSSVDNSPRTIAASHVLHRPLVPRHPPCALHNLTTKMLASTIQFSNNNPRQHTTHHNSRNSVPSQTPNSVPTTATTSSSFHKSSSTPSRTTLVLSTRDTPPTPTLTSIHASGRVSLLRKEVIQPHLPVRLPCYDFVPIASPTFDHSPRTNRLGHGLRVLPTFMT